MEIFLGITVVLAVVIFGALISIGNERQRKAIDELREQVVAWAIQDVHIKREKVKMEIKIDDPVAWLNSVITNVYGTQLDLSVFEVVDGPKALICDRQDGGKAIVSHLSLKDIKYLKKTKKLNKLATVSTTHPLLSMPKNTFVIRFSVLNAGLFFDSELAFAWEKLTESQGIHNGNLFVYLLP